jgi:hypothetical protein
MLAILVVTAIGMTIKPSILDSAFADKGGKPNDNAGDNPYKSCGKHSDQKKCANQPDYDEDNDDGKEDNPGEDNNGQ